jgi:hypothetical protein
VREARPETVMCAYNRVNGVYASQNAPLLTGIYGLDDAVQAFEIAGDRSRSMKVQLSF